MLALSPAMSVKCPKASMRKAIVGWDPITTARVASRYIVGDPAYAKKLNYCLAVVKNVPEGAARSYNQRPGRERHAARGSASGKPMK
jgi:hypothetical protein